MVGVSKITGRLLIERWGIRARHALYREDGTWYHLLERLPGALCDGRGYILFPTRESLETCPGIFIGKSRNWMNVPAGIASLPGYIRRAHPNLQLVLARTSEARNGF
jgi:hypothetical protein